MSARDFKVIKTRHVSSHQGVRGYVGENQIPPWSNTDKDPNAVTWGDMWDAIKYMPTQTRWRDLEAYAWAITNNYTLRVHGYWIMNSNWYGVVETSVRGVT